MSVHEKFPAPSILRDAPLRCAPQDEVRISPTLHPEEVRRTVTKDEPQALTPGQIIAAARAWLGTPYVHQASTKGAGCDCLGLIRGIYRELYGHEPEIPPPYTPDWNERAWYKSEREEPLLEAARRNLVEIEEPSPGDVLIFRVMRAGPAKHCGVMSTPDQFIHAYAGRAVIESWLNRWWRERVAGVFQFPEAER